MSGTGYTDPNYVKTAVCSKCEGLKTWNYWYHHDDTLCDDCYYIGSKYYDVSKEEAVQFEKEGVDPRLSEAEKARVDRNYDKVELKSREDIMKAVMLLDEVIYKLNEKVASDVEDVTTERLLVKKTSERKALLWALGLKA